MILKLTNTRTNISLIEAFQYADRFECEVKVCNQNHSCN